MNRILRQLVLASGLLTTSTVLAQWQSVPGESELNFIASFEGLQVEGRFGGFLVHADFNPGEPASGQLRVQVDLASADMDDAEVNEEIATTAWFDTPGHPQASFYSQEILAAKEGFTARGTLQLKGIQRPVQVPFRWLGDDSRAVMTGELVIDRSHFNIGSGEWADDKVIAYPVTINFRVTLEQ